MHVIICLNDVTALEKSVVFIVCSLHFFLLNFPIMRFCRVKMRFSWSHFLCFMV